MPICVVLLAVVFAYAAIFGIWWSKHPRTAQRVDGQMMSLVEVYSDRSLPGAENVWLPAFWTLQHIFGYRVVGFAPGADKDVVFWARNPPVK